MRCKTSWLASVRFVVLALSQMTEDEWQWERIRGQPLYRAMWQKKPPDQGITRVWFKNGRTLPDPRKPLPSGRRLQRPDIELEEANFQVTIYLTRPLTAQVKAIERQYEAFKKALQISRNGKHRERRDQWRDWLRILDAVAAGVKWKAIGRVVYGGDVYDASEQDASKRTKDGYYDASKRTKAAYKQAVKWRDSQLADFVPVFGQDALARLKKPTRLAR